MQQEKTPWDPMIDYAAMKRNTEDFMYFGGATNPRLPKFRVMQWLVEATLPCAVTCL